jgi:hypothetical protein
MKGAIPIQARRFWRAYLNPDVGTVIVYTRNLFYYNDERRYFIRQLDVNDDKTNLKSVLDRQGGFLPDPCDLNARHYLAAGDARCVIGLTQFFERNSVRTQAVASYEVSVWASPEPKNLVLLGNKRTFPKLAEILRDWAFDYQIEDRCIRARNREEPYEDKLTPEGGTVFGVISRAYDERYSGNITVLAGNAGSFFEGAGHFLSDERNLALVNERLGAEHKPFPPFEVLLRVEAEKKHLVTSRVQVTVADIREHRDDAHRTTEKRLGVEDREVCISFNSREKEEAEKFRDRLVAHGVRAWLSRDIPGAAVWAKELQKRFGKALVCVLLEGKEGLGETQLIEIGYLLRRQEHESGVSIFPVTLENVPQGRSRFPSALSHLNRTDLRSEWDKLVRDLKVALANLP